MNHIKGALWCKAHKVYGKTKDAQIEQLLGTEFPVMKGVPKGDEEPSMALHLMEMVLQMQQDQKAWLEAQQHRQEEVMERNQKAQKEMLDAALLEGS